MSLNSPASAYLVSARRSALGRIGGMHRNRRLEDLTSPVVEAALADAKISAAEVDEFVIGNTSQGGNPARSISLAAGLPMTASALTLDRQCGSGLDAILQAFRSIAGGQASIVVAGGAESLSTAPWRIAKPRTVFQLPHFMGQQLGGGNAGGSDLPQPLVASEALAQRHQISRAAQDAFTFKSHLRAEAAREARRFVGEIVPLRANSDESRDESASGRSLDDIEFETAYDPPDGTLTPANASQPHDGAAIAVIVSPAVWVRLGKPPALCLVASAVTGVAPDVEAEAPIAALRMLDRRLNGFDRSSVVAVELSETSAAQAIAVISSTAIDEGMLNADGGAIVRGQPAGAAGAVLVTRLFTRLVRHGGKHPGACGIATLGAEGGLGMAALFEAV